MNVIFSVYLHACVFLKIFLGLFILMMKPLKKGVKPFLQLTSWLYIRADGILNLFYLYICSYILAVLFIIVNILMII